MVGIGEALVEVEDVSGVAQVDAHLVPARLAGLVVGEEMRGLQVFVLVALQKLRGTGGGRLIWGRVRGQPEVVAEMSNNINVIRIRCSQT